MQQQLANVTHSTLNYTNRMSPNPAYEPAAVSAACDPYAMYGGVGVGGNMTPSGPVYGPSTTSPYQQFVDLSNGGSEPVAVTELQLKRRQLALQTQYYQTQLAYQQFVAQQQQQMAAAAAMMYEQQHYYGASASQYSAHSPAMHLPHPTLHVGGEPHGASAPLPPAEPCRCMYCEAANAPPTHDMQVQHQPHYDAVPPEPQFQAQNVHYEVQPQEPQPVVDAVEAVAAAPTITERSAKPTPPSPQSPPRREQVEVTPKRSGRNGGSALPATPSSSSKRGSQSASKHHSGSKGQHQSQHTPGRGRDNGPKASHAFVVEGHFKRMHRVQSTFAAAMGAAVIFEGDRGADIGRVVEMRDAGEHTEKLPRAMRLATAEEVREWQGLEVDGHAAADICATVVEEIGLPITIVDAVFQFDRNKLTFFYEAPERVDFRRLLAEMFNRFRCRIWMEMVPAPGAPAAASATGASQ